MLGAETSAAQRARCAKVRANEQAAAARAALRRRAVRLVERLITHCKQNNEVHEGDDCWDQRPEKQQVQDTA